MEFKWRSVDALILHPIRNCLSSRLAWLLATIHASWFLLAVANMSPPNPHLATFLEQVQGSTTTIFAGRPFHFAYESTLLQLLFLFDMPVIVAQFALSVLLIPLNGVFHLSLWTGSYVSAALMLLAGSVQWLIVGYLAELRIARRPNWSQRITGFHRSFVWLLGFVILFTAITVPLVNARSRALVNRHRGISFWSGF